MQRKKRAWLNFLRLSYLEDPSSYVEEWLKEDLRKVDIKTLFNRLNSFGITFNEEEFLEYARKENSVEDFFEKLFASMIDSNKEDQAFYIIFELWRRLLPEKVTISIFCDEFDYRIYKYRKHELESDELIQDALAILVDILEENFELQNDPTNLFDSLCTYCAHDIKNFIYNYILEQIEAKNYVYASELIDGFSPFMKAKRWFRLLKVKLLTSTNVIEANQIINHLVKDCDKNPSLSFQLELLQTMIKTGDRNLFIEVVKKTVPEVRKEQEFKYLLQIVAQFLRCIDREELEKEIIKILDKRSKVDEDRKIDNKEKDLLIFSKLLT